jgi:hypothetical protein
VSTATVIQSPDVEERIASLKAWRDGINQFASKPIAARTEGKIAVKGPCRLTKKERRAGETKAFRNRREKSRNKSKMAKASRKRK